MAAQDHPEYEGMPPGVPAVYRARLETLRVHMVLAGYRDLPRTFRLLDRIERLAKRSDSGNLAEIAAYLHDAVASACLQQSEIEHPPAMPFTGS